MSRTPNIPSDDERSAIEKIMAGDIKKFDTLNGVETARMATGFLPGAGQLADLPLAYMQGELEADKKYTTIQRNWGNLNEASSRSRGIKMETRSLAARWKDRMGEAVTSLIGGLGGMWLGAVLLGSVIPFAGGFIGGLIGAMVGGYLANMAYNAVFPPENHDGTTLATTMYKAQKQGEAVPPQMVFAVLASNLPRKARKRIEKDLERMTGSTSFNAALESGRMNELQVLMRRYDLEIRADTHMKRDPVDIRKTASEQYAEWINHGQLDARTLMFTKELPIDPLVIQPAQQDNTLVAAPVTPGAMGRGIGKGPI